MLDIVRAVFTILMILAAAFLMFGVGAYVGRVIVERLGRRIVIFIVIVCLSVGAWLVLSEMNNQYKAACMLIVLGFLGGTLFESHLQRGRAEYHGQQVTSHLKVNAVITVPGFLSGYVGPVGCIRLGTSLGLKGLIGIRGPGEDFTVMIEGEKATITHFINEIVSECPWPIRFARRIGLAGGILVTWAEATGQFDSLPPDMPFKQAYLPSRRR